jgi:hypothetical protein
VFNGGGMRPDYILQGGFEIFYMTWNVTPKHDTHNMGLFEMQTREIPTPHDPCRESLGVCFVGRMISSRVLAIGYLEALRIVATLF